MRLTSRVEIADEDFDFFCEVLASAIREVNELYYKREAARVVIRSEQDEYSAQFDAIIDAYLAKIHAMRTGVAYRRLLLRRDINEIPKAYIAELLGAEHKRLWETELPPVSPDL